MVEKTRIAEMWLDLPPYWYSLPGAFIYPSSTPNSSIPDGWRRFKILVELPVFPVEEVILGEAAEVKPDQGEAHG